MKNPYDGGFKTLAEDHPELLLRLLGILAPGKKTQVTNVLRELSLDPVQIDHAYLLDDSTIVHFEAITSWDARRIGRLALYHYSTGPEVRVTDFQPRRHDGGKVRTETAARAGGIRGT